MAAPTGPVAPDATRRFEELWQRAASQPEVVEVEAKKIEVDTSPVAMLNGLQAIAAAARAQGEMDDRDYQAIVRSSGEIRQAFARVTPERLQQHLKAVKAQARATAGTATKPR